MAYSNRLMKCIDPSCSKNVNVFSDHEGPILCSACASRFRQARANGFPGGNDDETYFEFIRIHGTTKDEIRSYLKGYGLYDDEEQPTK